MPVLVLPSRKREGYLCWFWFLQDSVSAVAVDHFPSSGKSQALGECTKMERRKEKSMRSQPGPGARALFGFPRVTSTTWVKRLLFQQV